MGIEDLLTRTHGPLLSTGDLARLLGRTEQGLRFTARGNSDLAPQVPQLQP